MTVQMSKQSLSFIPMFYDFGAFSYRYISKQIMNKTIFCFMDIFKTCSDELIEHYFEKIDAVAQSGKAASFVAMKIAHRYFKECKTVKKSSLQDIADKLESKHQLMQLIITELSRYSQFANGIIAEEIKEAQEAEKTYDDSKLHERVFQGVLPHFEQVSERIDFLTLFAQECSSKLSKDQLA